MVNYWASRWIVWTKNNLSSCHHHFDPDSSVLFSSKSCSLPVLVKLIVFSKCNKFCSVLVVVNGFPTNNRSRYDRIQIFLWSQISYVLSRLDLSVNLSDNITLRKSSKRVQSGWVQCLNEFMFHSHLRHPKVGCSLCKAAPSPQKILEKGARGRLYSFMAAQLKSSFV